MTASQRRKHDLAYACFLVPGLFKLIAALASVIPMDTGTAGGIGFLVLIPLVLVAMAAVPLGIFYSIEFRRDRALLIVAVLTILMVIQFFAEAGSVAFGHALSLAYGVLVLGLVASWFFVRRQRAYPPDG